MGLKAVVCFRRASETAGIPAAGAIRPRRIPAIDSPAGAQRLSCKLCVCVCSHIAVLAKDTFQARRTARICSPVAAVTRLKLSLNGLHGVILSHRSGQT